MFNDLDDLINEAVSVCIQYDRASASLLQRRLSIGYARAARIIDQLESYGVLAPNNGNSNPRKVLIKTYKEFEKIDKKVLNSKKDEEFQEPDKNYTPVPCDFLPNKVKGMTKPSDLPYLKTDLEKIGNLIVTGNVISKKYEYIKTYLLFLLSKFDLNDVRLIINDSAGKLNKFNNIPHLLTPIITNSDMTLSALRWLNREVDRRIELMNKDDSKNFSNIIYIDSLYSNFDDQIEALIKRISSIGAYAKIHLILIADRLGDFPKSIKDNIPAKLELNKFGENEAVFSFKEKIKIKIIELNESDIQKYLKTCIPN